MNIITQEAKKKQAVVKSGRRFVGLSMMCYKNQKTSPLDKKENK